MELQRHRRVGKRGWRGALVVIAICSLTLSVATRFWATGSSQSIVVKSIERRIADPKRQHLDRDAARWMAPSTDFSTVELPAVETRLAPAGPLLPKHVFSDNLYNRPPPSSLFLL
jgi:hypothetical protein